MSRRDDAEPLGAQLDLRGRLLARDVEHGTLAGMVLTGPRKGVAELDQQGATCRCPGSPLISTTEPGTMPPPEHPAQLADGHGYALVTVGRDVGQGLGPVAAAGNGRARWRPAEPPG